MDFLDSSFFQSTRPSQRLPTPAEVRALSEVKNSRPPPVIIEHLNLLVKFGPRVNVAEAQCLWLIRTILGDEVPVPEVYGWRVDGLEVFIYMQLVRGVTLKSRWEHLNALEKTSVCGQLCRMITSLRQIKQEPPDQFIGSVNCQAPQDIIFQNMPVDGPFSGVKPFNDWFSSLPQRFLADYQKFQDPMRLLLPDDGAITFTHADLHEENILISQHGPPQILAIIDWGQSGWYPDYWEYCKAAYTCMYSGEWRMQWIPMFLAPRLDEHEAFSEYVMAIGAL
ncbi:phosphotransferase enzyme family protein [Hyaloscypha variabilis F]|uniref:Phosphotransferase enzyme family protein n=1 Tax=Hyaloscypha variabilis (strain UAMH 11265 / GT02V1 / F) TaxID=1149755 RepID=A0A2J6R468_HYAVF|nr:phosphotransferase enzyme family protein [Hyaloscypha variabilis F]